MKTVYTITIKEYHSNSKELNLIFVKGNNTISNGIHLIKELKMKGIGYSTDNNFSDVIRRFFVTIYCQLCI